MRINTLLAAVTAALMALSAGCAKDGPLESSGPGPANVFIITLDTTRADHIGAFGSRDVKTPSLDALARDSVVFDECYSTAHSTNPSHTSIFTSQYVRDHGVLDNKYRVPDVPWFLPKVFKAAGYVTAAVTSGGHLDQKSNINQGFDEFISPEGVLETKAGVTTIKAIEAVDALMSSGTDAKLFMWVHYFDPHMLYDPPAPYDSMYNLYSDKRINWDKYFVLDYPPHRKYLGRSADPEYFRNLYKGEVSYMDEQIGAFVKALKDRGMYDDSVIVVVADHGESLGEHEIYWDHRELYDTNIHVPMMIKAAAGGKPGRRAHLVSSVDIYPTVLYMTGITPPGTVMGKSLVGIIGNPDYPDVRNVVYFQSVYENQIGVRNRDYTYIRRIIEGQGVGNRKLVDSSEGMPELFDNNTDKAQTRNLAAVLPEVAASFEQSASVFINDRKNVRTASEIADKAHLDKLKALGYVQ